MKWMFCAALVVLAGLSQAQTLRWASQGDIQTADPHSQNESMTNMVNGQVYEKLVRRDKTMAIGPGLAVSWTNPDPLTWRFKLRDKVKFHDGSAFSADDVVFSILR
ncbi:MAG: ABC transporter substrate-binding protein, partial [Burkholderiaceae bacterium]